jgi:hypothetical protein
MIYSEEFDIICITETWLNEKITNGLIDPDSRYRVFRDRNDHRGGGICVLVHKRFHVAEVPVIRNFPWLEIVCVDIFCGADRVRLFAVYKQPAHNASSVDYIFQLTEIFV